MSKEDVARFVTKHRAEQRMKPATLAELSGISHSMISRVESGTRVASRETLERIGRGLNLRWTDHARLLELGGYTSEAARTAQELRIQESVRFLEATCKSLEQAIIALRKEVET